MGDFSSPKFEDLREKLSSLDVPKGEARELVWVIPERIGVALTAAGAHEIFIQGPPLEAALPLVIANLQHDRWEPRVGGQVFEASRVLLGAASHFAAVAALIVTELSRLDLSTEAAVQRSFAEVEPIIELAIRRAALSNEAIIGLHAELHVLRVALLVTPEVERPLVLPSWRGWAPGRDFQFGRNGIEVKATLRATSRHAFSGIHQLEAQEVGSNERENVHLLSIGLEAVSAGGYSLPELVDDLLSLLGERVGARTATQSQLLSMIASYGGAGAPNYEHDVMKNWSVYQQKFGITFARMYDVSDPLMRLLDRNLVEQTFAVVNSVSFELSLPNMVSAFNPAEDWQRIIADILRAN